jgi:beta-1,4-mannooligosaccharide/beta-1,4-mannosyl-N-acetylglucosamine phosphorylase
MPVVRHPRNPVLTADQVPYPADLVFNAGVTRWQGRYVMVFRNDFDVRDNIPNRTNLGLAWSDDGIEWQVAAQPVFELRTDEFRRAYDPRLTVLDGRLYLCFAVDTQRGEVRGGIAVTDDLEHFDILSISAPDNRNMVLFPERINGRIARLERPFPMYSRRDESLLCMYYADSPDGRDWGNHQFVMGEEHVAWANSKVGPAAPPVKTDAGWLALFHAVDTDPQRAPFDGWEANPWTKRYTAGIALLDLHQPWKVLGLYDRPLLEPETDYELKGFRGSVIFPTGMVLEGSGEVKVYYGGADTVMALATAPADELVRLCLGK